MMEHDRTENSATQRPKYTPRMIMKFLALLCIVFVFVPAFVVSCSGQKVSISAMNVVVGIREQGFTLVEPNPLLLVCLILPVITLIALCSKARTASKTGLCALICMAADGVVWLTFMLNVKAVAKENFCVAETTLWFYINMLCIIAIVILSALSIRKIVEMDKGFL